MKAADANVSFDTDTKQFARWLTREIFSLDKLDLVTAFGELFEELEKVDPSLIPAMGKVVIALKSWLSSGCADNNEDDLHILIKQDILT